MQETSWDKVSARCLLVSKLTALTLLLSIGRITPASAGTPEYNVTNAPEALAEDTRLQAQGIRAQVTSLLRTTLAAEMPGRLTRLKGLPGDRFKKGDLLARFDCTEQEALLRKAKASEKSADTELAVSKRLVELDAGSTLEVSKAEARLAESHADAAVMKARVKKCRLYAPFAGRVAVRQAAEHQYVRIGTPLLDVFAENSLEVRLIVPSRWLAKIRKGDRFKIAIDETGTVYNAEIIRTGAVVDPISQSVEIAGRIIDSATRLLPGMSGWAQFPYE
ncbi:MAG: efflux RND transporter periplasmic adaptor subunit [Pontibacterium sp.]